MWKKGDYAYTDRFGDRDFPILVRLITDPNPRPHFITSDCDWVDVEVDNADFHYTVRTEDLRALDDSDWENLGYRHGYDDVQPESDNVYYRIGFSNGSDNS